MHNLAISPDVNFVDARHYTDSNTTSSSLVSSYKDEASLNSALAAHNAAYYTAAVLALLTLNDKIFAVRHISDSAGFLPSGTVTGVGRSVAKGDDVEDDVPQEDEASVEAEAPAVSPEVEAALSDIKKTTRK